MKAARSDASQTITVAAIHVPIPLIERPSAMSEVTISETIVGEPEGIWAFLGSGRLAAPIGAHRPDAVFHGHAHHGRPLGAIGTVPVHNVARPVLAADFHLARF